MAAETTEPGSGNGNGRGGDYRLSHPLLHGDVRHYPILVGLAGPLKGRRFTIEKEVVTLGRDMQADILLKDSSAFRYHARIIYTNAENYGDVPECRILDGGSATGTFVNGDRVGPEGCVLSDKDRVQVGRSVFAFLIQNHLDQSVDQAIAEMVTHDRLTGLFDAVNFRQVLTVEIERARRYEEELTLLLLDVDDFTRVNASYGREGGNRVLRAVGALLVERLRCCDVAARLSEDHVAILLPETPMTGACVLASRLLQGVSELEVLMPSNAKIGVTASIGIACFDPTVAHADDFLSRANEALVRAQSQGRGQFDTFGA